MSLRNGLRLLAVVILTGGLADAHIDFYNGVIDTWESYVLEMEKEGVVLPA